MEMRAHIGRHEQGPLFQHAIGTHRGVELDASALASKLMLSNGSVIDVIARETSLMLVLAFPPSSSSLAAPSVVASSSGCDRGNNNGALLSLQARLLGPAVGSGVLCFGGKKRQTRRRSLVGPSGTAS